MVTRSSAPPELETGPAARREGSQALRPCSVFEFDLEGGDIGLGRAVAGGCGVQPEAAGLVQIPFGFFTVGEGDPSADKRSGSGNLVDGDSDFAGGCRFGCCVLDCICGWLCRFFGFLEFQLEVIGQKPGVKIG